MLSLLTIFLALKRKGKLCFHLHIKLQTFQKISSDQWKLPNFSTQLDGLMGRKNLKENLICSKDHTTLTLALIVGNLIKMRKAIETQL